MLPLMSKNKTKRFKNILLNYILIKMTKKVEIRYKGREEESRVNVKVRDKKEELVNLLREDILVSDETKQPAEHSYYL